MEDELLLGLRRYNVMLLLQNIEILACWTMVGVVCNLNGHRVLDLSEGGIHLAVGASQINCRFSIN